MEPLSRRESENERAGTSSRNSEDLRLISLHQWLDEEQEVDNNVDHHQEVLSRSKKGKEKISESVGYADKINHKNKSVADPKKWPEGEIPEDVEILSGILKFFAAKKIKQYPYIFGYNEMKDFTNNFLRSNADPEAVTRRIMELMARYVDSLNNKDGGDPGPSENYWKVHRLCEKIYVLTHENGQERGSKSVVVDEGNADKNRENELVAADARKGPQKKIPEDIEILNGVLTFFAAKKIKRFPKTFSYEDMKNFVKTYLHSNADPAAVDRRFRELMGRHMYSLSKNFGDPGPSSFDHYWKVHRLCEKIRCLSISSSENKNVKQRFCCIRWWW